MRLADYRLYSYRLRYPRPVRWSDIVEEAAPFVLLRLTADTGEEGVAEITVKPTWCGVTARSLMTAIEEIFIPILKKSELDDPAELRAALDRVPENLAAKTLIDNAVWDLQAASLKRPLWSIWGGAPVVELSWAVTRQAPAAMAAEAAQMVERYGFSTLKVKGGQGFDVDVAGLRDIGAAVGHDIRLYVDANGAYPVDRALDYANAMADAGAAVLEDPCPLEPNAQFEALIQRSPIPILVDFGCTSLRDAALFLERAAQGLSTKPGRFGLSQCRTMEARARQSGCGVVAGLMGESALGTLAGLQFIAAVERPMLPAELTWYLAMTDQILREIPVIKNGRMTLPDCAALASLVDWQAVEKFA